MRCWTRGVVLVLVLGSRSVRRLRLRIAAAVRLGRSGAARVLAVGEGLGLIFGVLPLERPLTDADAKMWREMANSISRSVSLFVS